tara:strand:- start:241 stop:1452 length:1212 start_codon:yes stop_codon:yes gene_type:complete
MFYIKTNFFIYLVLFSSHVLLGNELQSSVESYQKVLVNAGVTGSNVAGVYSKDKTLAFSIVNSNIEGDKSISNETIFPIWSMSKPITIAAMMILRDRQLFDVKDPVKKYLPYFDNLQCKSEEESIGTYNCANDLLIEHLLTHRSGYGYVAFGANVPDHRDPFKDLDEFVRHVANRPVNFEPGTEYLYGINQAILGRLVEVLSGQEFYLFLKENIFDPLEMKDTKFYLTEEDREKFQPLYRKAQKEAGINLLMPDSGVSNITENFDELNYDMTSKKQLGGEGLVSTFNDYRKFCEMLLSAGSYNDKIIISEDSFELMTSVVTDHFIAGGYDDGFGYAYSMFSLQEPLLDGTGSPRGIFGWSGYHNTHFWIDQTNGIYGLFMSRTTPFQIEIQKQFRSAVYKNIN